MLSKYLKYMRVGLVVGSFLLLASLLYAAFNRTEENTASEKCIRCHIATFNQGIQSRQMHTPFWERQCTVCHLPTGSNWGTTVSTEATGPLTGTVVSQQNLWRKLKSFSAQTGSVSDHLVSLPGLDMATAYRFRILVSPVDKASKGDGSASLWIGLRPKEVADLSRGKQLDIRDELSASLTALVGPVSLYRSENAIFISWATTQPLFGWVELQQLEGLSPTSLAEAVEVEDSPTAKQHPAQRAPEDLAIKVCYQCHPQATLGTSHPVNLYGGRDVRIPDELPTVEGMLTCITCHNPHGTEGKNLVRETIKTKLCVACHYKFKNSSPSTMFD